MDIRYDVRAASLTEGNSSRLRALSHGSHKRTVMIEDGQPACRKGLDQFLLLFRHRLACPKSAFVLEGNYGDNAYRWSDEINHRLEVPRAFGANLADKIAIVGWGIL